MKIVKLIDNIAIKKAVECAKKYAYKPFDKKSSSGN